MSLYLRPHRLPAPLSNLFDVTSGPAVLSITAGLFLLSVCGCKKQVVAAPPLPPPQVQTIEVKPQDVSLSDEWIGTLQASVNATIRAQVDGILMKMDYEEGGTVKKGDVLFQLDDRTYKAALEEAKGALGQAQANLTKTEIDVKRLGALLPSKAVSQQEYDNAVQANLAAKAAIVSSKATVDKAALNVDFSKITSPLNGIAGLAKAQVGDLVTANSTELTTVATVDPIKAYFTVSEQEYLKFREENPDKDGKQANAAKNLTFEMALANGEWYPHKGKFFAGDVSVNVSTGSLRLCGIFPNPGNLLRPGQYCRVRAVMEKLKDAIVIPERAVSEMQGVRQVGVVTPDNKASIRTVKTGPRVDKGWVIEDGLKSGDKVIVEGFLKIKDGLPVVATSYKAPPGETPQATPTAPAPEPKPATEAKATPEVKKAVPEPKKPAPKSKSDSDSDSERKTAPTAKSSPDSKTKSSGKSKSDSN